MAQTFPQTISISKSVDKINVIPEERRNFLQAYHLLHVAIVALPLLAGIDKFFNAMAVWDRYLAPVAISMTHLPQLTIMHFVGAIEIMVAIGVALRPKYFGYVVSAWMALIIINLFVLGNHFDVAFRDLGLGMAAFALSKMANIYENHKAD